MDAFVVESPVHHSEDGPVGTARVYVGTEARAIEIASQHPSRTWRRIALDEMPEQARAALVAARASE